MLKPLNRRIILRLASIGRPITIPQSLIEKLAPFGSARYVKVGKPLIGDKSSGKGPFEKEWQNHAYNSDDPELIKWLSEGGNYGVMAGRGIIIIDLDEPDDDFQSKVNTFTVKSGRESGLGHHFYFMSGIEENALIYDKSGKQIGNLQADRKIVVGPNCRHNSGGIYKITNDVSLGWISKKDLNEIFGDRIKWSSEVQKEIDEEAEEERDRVGDLIRIGSLISLDDFKRHGDELQGSHPFHGSSTGRNFSVNIKKGSWHCFRHNSGGGGPMLLAVKEGLLKCEEARPHSLRGQAFIEVLKIAKEKYGIAVVVPDEEMNPDVERFFDGKPKKLNPALVGAEILRENHFFTRSTKGQIYRYNPANGIYEPEAEDFINAEVARKLGKHYSSNRRQEVEAFIRSKTLKKMVETDKYVHAVLNGILDVQTLEVKPFSPDFCIFNALPVKYDPNAKCEKFLKFLKEVVPPEKDRMVLQEVVGYCLIKDARFQKALLLIGRKQNGKGTFLNVISALLGEDNVSNVELQKLTDNMRFITSQLHNRLANICADLPDKNLEETGTFKRIVSGDSIAAEFKYGQPFEFRPYAKLLFSANVLPKIPKDTEAFLVRWLLVEFPNSFLQGDPRRDENLKDKLTTPEELSGILNWALEGAQRLLKNNAFSTSETLEELEDRWTIMSDSVKVFIERCIQDTPDSEETVDKVFGAYLQFCQDHKVEPLSKKRFMKAFREDGLRSTRKTRVVNESVELWKNVRLKSENESLNGVLC
jgi:P4 family phage/plasmid primase-like protien